MRFYTDVHEWKKVVESRCFLGSQHIPAEELSGQIAAERAGDPDYSHWAQNIVAKLMGLIIDEIERNGMMSHQDLADCVVNSAESDQVLL